MKLKIQKIFTNIRNIYNNKEDELMLNIDKEYDNNCIKEEIIKDIERLPDKIKSSSEKCKNLERNNTNLYKI